MIGMFSTDERLIGVFKDMDAVDSWVESNLWDGRRIERLEASIVVFERARPGVIEYRASEHAYVRPIDINKLLMQYHGAYRIFPKFETMPAHTDTVPRSK